ncbi:hypothetical protein Tdes44962_MAKER00857 [Teratosphaeria destructans]|uniref:Uncharacterized protein n=1 Tax=Teratosphaeria destructans TaxID=418781 RepID=A0A9W7SKJ6_9PEZI|nr:hypothetical protein Tdes44962_MAKER00857 [Teratosphaeria destructans]
MNTRASVAYGWGILIVAGAGSYYFAKRSINSDRAERAEAAERRRQQLERMRIQEAASRTPRASNKKVEAVADDNPSPGKIAQADPAPATHAQEQDAIKGKYEATEPFRSRKGDRFS